MKIKVFLTALVMLVMTAGVYAANCCGSACCHSGAACCKRA